jgi:hypothetical protein
MTWTPATTMLAEKPQFCNRVAALGFALAIFACGDHGFARMPRDAAAPKDSADAALDWLPPDVAPPAAGSNEPFWLSQTGLYRDIDAKTLAPGLIEFEPKYSLWSDGASKQRFLRMPPDAYIDTSDMDHWSFPSGTMLFKEFSLDGKRLETRLIMRTGPGPSDYFMGAFLWNDDDSDALFVPAGQDDVRGTAHDVPSTKQCGNCHNGEPGRILGLSAVQGGERWLAERLLQSKAAPFAVPGGETTARALGYLHANCGHCHNLHGTAWPDTEMNLRLRVSEQTFESTALSRTTVDVAMRDRKLRALRIATGDAAASGIHYRMSLRGPKIQMPPIATERVDPTGLESISQFIEALAPNDDERGP